VTLDLKLDSERVDGHAAGFRDTEDQTLSMAEAARLLGRDRTRLYALLRSGDLVAAPADEDGVGPVRIVRASLERWLVAGGARGGPLTPRNAWALVGLASGDQPFSERLWDGKSSVVLRRHVRRRDAAHSARGATGVASGPRASPR
jgi:hypothetical protein